MEQWKDIEGYDGVYQVSNLGKVRSLKFGKEKILKGGTMKGGYTSMIFIKNHIKKMNTVSRLVAQYFIPNPNNHPYVLHKKEDLIDGRLDNSEHNLYWGNQSQNMKDMFSRNRSNNHFIKTPPNPNLGKTLDNSPISKRLNQYSLSGEFIKEWGSIKGMCNELGFCRSSISKCCNGKQKSYNGFIFEFIK